MELSDQQRAVHFGFANRDTIKQYSLNKNHPLNRPIRQALALREYGAHRPKFVSSAVTDLYHELEPVQMGLPVRDVEQLLHDWDSKTFTSDVVKLANEHGQKIWNDAMDQRDSSSSPVVKAGTDEFCTVDLFWQLDDHREFIYLQLEHLLFVKAIINHRNHHYQKERELDSTAITTAPRLLVVLKISNREAFEQKLRGQFASRTLPHSEANGVIVNRRLRPRYSRTIDVSDEDDDDDDHDVKHSAESRPNPVVIDTPRGTRERKRSCRAQEAESGSKKRKSCGVLSEVEHFNGISQGFHGTEAPVGRSKGSELQIQTTLRMKDTADRFPTPHSLLSAGSGPSRLSGADPGNTSATDLEKRDVHISEQQQKLVTRLMDDLYASNVPQFSESVGNIMTELWKMNREIAHKNLGEEYYTQVDEAVSQWLEWRQLAAMLRKQTAITLKANEQPPNYDYKQWTQKLGGKDEYRNIYRKLQHCRRLKDDKLRIQTSVRSIIDALSIATKQSNVVQTFDDGLEAFYMQMRGWYLAIAGDRSLVDKVEST